MKSRARTSRSVPPRRKPAESTPDSSSAADVGAAAAIAPARSAAPCEPRRRADRELDLACLLVGSPREVLARILPEDPLDVRDAVVAVLRAQCVFLDADRVHLRALARIARAGLRFAGARTDLASWIRAEVAGAVDEVVREEAEVRPVDSGSTFVQFARPLGLDPEAVRRGCAAFNRLPHADRAAFFALVVRSVGLEALARETGESPSMLGRRARRGLDAVLHANHPELPPAVPSQPTPVEVSR